MDNIEKVNLDASEIRQITIYNNGELAFIENINDIDITRTIQTEFYVMVLVLEGKASVDINGTPYTTYKNDIFVCTPNNIIENDMASIDFKCHSIGMSQEYIRKTFPMADNILWDMKKIFEKNPVYTLHSDEVTIWNQYYELLCSKTRQPSVVQKKIIDTIMLAFFYDMQNIMGRVINKITPRPFTSGEQLFKRFIDLLETSYPKNREVSYYADHLHVTPKYLSSICKPICGHTASTIIDQYVLKDIEFLMKYSQKSVKEIANELDFPNISFFGKYVKKHLGTAPRQLREKYRKECGQQK